MKMAVFFIENAFCVGLLQSFYDGGDLDEHGCSSMIYLEIARGRCYAQCKFSLMENGFRWCEKVLHGGDVTQNHEKSIQRLSLNGKVLSLFRPKLICLLHKVFCATFLVELKIMYKYLFTI